MSSKIPSVSGKIDARNFNAPGDTTEAGIVGSNGIASLTALKNRVTSLAGTISETTMPVLKIPPGWEQAAPLIKIAVAAAAIGGLAWWQYRSRSPGHQVQQAHQFVSAQRPEGVTAKEWRRQTKLTALLFEKAAQQDVGIKTQVETMQQELKGYKGQLERIQRSSGKWDSRVKQTNKHSRTPNRSKEDGEMADASDLPVSWKPNEQNTTPNTTTPRRAMPHPNTHSPLTDEALADELYSTPIPLSTTSSTLQKSNPGMVEFLIKTLEENSGKVTAGKMTEEEYFHGIRRQLDLYRYPETNGMSPSKLREQQELRGLSSIPTSSGGKRKVGEADLEVKEVAQALKRPKTDATTNLATPFPGRYQLRSTHARRSSVIRSGAKDSIKVSEKAKGKQKVEALQPNDVGYLPSPTCTAGTSKRTSDLRKSFRSQVPKDRNVSTKAKGRLEVSLPPAPPLEEDEMDIDSNIILPVELEAEDFPDTSDMEAEEPAPIEEYDEVPESYFDYHHGFPGDSYIIKGPGKYAITSRVHPFGGTKVYSFPPLSVTPRVTTPHSAEPTELISPGAQMEMEWRRQNGIKSSEFETPRVRIDEDKGNTASPETQHKGL